MSRCQLTNGQMASALACGMASASHLSFKMRRVRDNKILWSQEIRIRVR
jgi:hypothetical protein